MLEAVRLCLKDFLELDRVTMVATTALAVAFGGKALVGWNCEGSGSGLKWSRGAGSPVAGQGDAGWKEETGDVGELGFAHVAWVQLVPFELRSAEMIVAAEEGGSTVCSIRVEPRPSIEAESGRWAWIDHSQVLKLLIRRECPEPVSFALDACLFGHVEARVVLNCRDFVVVVEHSLRHDGETPPTVDVGTNSGAPSIRRLDLTLNAVVDMRM